MFKQTRLLALSLSLMFSVVAGQASAQDKDAAPPFFSGPDQGQVDTTVPDINWEVFTDLYGKDWWVSSRVPLDEKGEFQCRWGLRSYIHSLANEDGHYLATSLEPPTYPFTATSVRYRLRDNSAVNFDPNNDADILTDKPETNCASNVKHRLFGFILKDGDPLPGDPTPVFDLEVDPGSAHIDFKEVNVDIPDVVLQTDEVLYVAIEMVHPADYPGQAGICVPNCAHRMAPSDHHWWSNASTPDYPWASMSYDFGYHPDYFVSMTGHPGN